VITSSDRVAYGATILLTVMAVSLITADKRPATRFNTWLDEFQLWTFSLTLIPVLETVVLQRLQSLNDEDEGSKSDTASQSEAKDGKKERRHARLFSKMDDRCVDVADRNFRVIYPVFAGCVYYYIFWPMRGGALEDMDLTAMGFFIALILIWFVLLLLALTLVCKAGRTNVTRTLVKLDQAVDDHVPEVGVVFERIRAKTRGVLDESGSGTTSSEEGSLHRRN